MNERRWRNYIGLILSERGMLESVGEVKEEVRRFFSEKFEKSDSNRPLLEEIPFKELSLEERRSLEVPFSNNDIKEAMRGCEGSKSPGPNG